VIAGTALAESWTEANQRHLTAAVDEVRRRLTAYVDGAEPDGANGDGARAGEWTGEDPPALEALCAAFGLSPFERALLLLCAGGDLDAGFASLVATAQGRQGGSPAEPTFGLALAALPGAHWSAITPAGPLRRWRLVEVLPGAPVTASPLRIDERILHHLAGVSQVDDRLAGFRRVLPLDADLPPSQSAVAERAAAAWERAPGPLPVIQLCGGDPAARRAVAAAACAAIGVSLLAFPAWSLHPEVAEVEAFARLCERESALLGAALLLEEDDGDRADPTGGRPIERFAESVGGALFLSVSQPRAPAHRATVVLDVARPTAGEQRSLWRAEVGAQARNHVVDALVSQFDLTAGGIRDAAATARAAGATDDAAPSLESLWEVCRRQVRPRLDDLAQRIEPAAGWKELILPDAATQTLRELGIQARHRSTVHDRWGFAERGGRGLGISALFAGPSGTGKTMAAEVLAGDLRLDLYRIDLSEVVSKYIGETEKNLRRVFDAAEAGGAVLLFDEADALFGKRTEVKDSHDRYANIEVSYLLQRMEAYRGLAILTTNMKEALDGAFLRRIRFVVQFPFPDTAARTEIWRTIFPAAAPVDGLDYERLARLNLSGGSIRNVALSAAFLAADDGSPVRMPHLVRAARQEYAKLDKTFTGAELGERR